MQSSGSTNRLRPVPVSAWKAWLRKGQTLATVTLRRPTVPDLADFPQRVKDISSRAAREASLPRKISALWQIEGLTLSVAQRHLSTLSLRECRLPLEAGPPAQCGLSMAAVLNQGFDPDRLSSLLSEKASPLFLDFSFETLGLMLAAYEPTAFGRVAGLLGDLKLMHRSRIKPVDAGPFLARLPAPERRLAAHGFGRLTYIRSHSLSAAVEAIRARSYLPFSAAVKGAVAAYVLINSHDLGCILELAEVEFEDDLRDGIVGGLQNVLQLVEWSLPGSLAAIETPSSAGRTLLEEAVATAMTQRALGQGPGMVA